MNDSMILARLRRFLFVLAALLCVGTFVELWSAEHYQEPIQFPLRPRRARSSHDPGRPLAAAANDDAGDASGDGVERAG